MWHHLKYIRFWINSNDLVGHAKNWISAKRGKILRISRYFFKEFWCVNDSSKFYSFSRFETQAHANREKTTQKLIAWQTCGVKHITTWFPIAWMKGKCNSIRQVLKSVACKSFGCTFRGIENTINFYRQSPRIHLERSLDWFSFYSPTVWDL